MEAIIKITDKPETMELDIAVALDQEYEASSPAHRVARYVIQNFHNIIKDAKDAELKQPSLL